MDHVIVEAEDGLRLIPCKDAYLGNYYGFPRFDSAGLSYVSRCYLDTELDTDDTPIATAEWVRFLHEMGVRQGPWLKVELLLPGQCRGGQGLVG